MEFVSLRSIIYDILNIIRGAKITDDDPISERQIESWIHQYRATLLKRDLDKGKTANPDYIQELTNSDGSALIIVPEEQETRTVYRTNIQIPKTIDFNFKSGIVFIGDVEGNEIQLIPASRANWQPYNKYTSKDIVAYLKNRYIYLVNDDGLKYIRLRGIFEVPTELPGMTIDSKYPIPINMLETLKGMILKQELGIEYIAPSDDVNDDKHEVESDVKGMDKKYTTKGNV